MNTAAVPFAIRPELARRLMIRLLPLLIVLYIIKEIDRSNVSFAALFMNQALGFSPIVYGTGAGIYFVGYVLMNIPANMLAYKYGPRRSLAVMMLLWGLVAMAMALIRNAQTFYALRFVLGVAEAGFLPAVLLYLCAWFPRRERATAIAWLSSAASLQVVISGPLSGAILEMPAFLGIAPWQWLFIIEAVPAIVLAFAVNHYLAETPADAEWLAPSERSELAQAVSVGEPATPDLSVAHGMRALQNWRVWLASLMSMTIGCGFYAMILWLPQIIRHFQSMRPLYIGIITAVPFLLSVFAMVWMGWHSDRTGRRYPYIVGGMALGGAGLAASAYFSSDAVVALVLLIVGLTIYLPIIAPFWTFVSELVAGPERAVGIALAVAIGSLGGFVGSFLVGVFREMFGNFQAGLYGIALITVLGAAIMLVFGSRMERTAIALRAAPAP